METISSALAMSDGVPGTRMASSPCGSYGRKVCGIKNIGVYLPEALNMRWWLANCLKCCGTTKQAVFRC